MKMVSERWGSGKYHDRRAIIYGDTNNEFLVECYEKGMRIKVISCKGHSENYAEDTAENWVIGVIDPQVNVSWDEEETDKRMNVIGQNGNDGLHYDVFETMEQEKQRRMTSSKTRFDLEQEILYCWNIVDDIKLIHNHHLDKRKLTDDELSNVLIGLQELYQIKFETLFETFEACITKKEI